EQILQEELAGRELDVAQVVAVEINDIEQRVDEPPRAPRRERFLQQPEAACSVRLQRNELTVEQDLIEGEPNQGLLERGQPRGPVLSVAGQQPDVRATDFRDQAV